MRTADTIAQMAEQKSVKAPRKRKSYKPHPNSLKNLRPPWPKGYSGNPGGEPGFDVAAWLCRKVIENNLNEAYAGLAGQVAKGNGYVFNVIADRGYGKLKETKEIVRKYQNASRDDLSRRITELLRDLGLAAVRDLGLAAVRDLGLAAEIDGTNGDARRVEGEAGAQQTADLLPGNGTAKA